MENNIVPEKVCDLGCGTGELIKLLADVHDEASYVGIDISGDMINVAKKKCKKIEECVLVSGDIRNFKLEKRANLITCMYDTINHILKKE
ncbi:MAG: class I SAM-dependent methyltransferase [Clostridia bacterium]|nr:class I SAM-dependent methyltransferase [Clostridia bacterium]